MYGQELTEFSTVDRIEDRPRGSETVETRTYESDLRQG